MKKLLVLPVFVVIVLAFGVFWFKNNTSPVSSDKVFKDFLIIKGQGASVVANNLYKAGLIKSPLAFKVYAQVTNKANKIQAGEYRLSPSFSLFDLFAQLGRGPTEIWVTIPEGLRREEIAQKFADALSKDDVFIEEFLEVSDGKEGYLFPETYLFPKDTTATKVVNKMLSTFESKTANLNLTKTQVVLASLIERETKTKAEKPVVAGVILNRINNDWPIQIDAAVQYAVANEKCKTINNQCDWWPILTKNDLEINSSFNSYKFTGLPPTPIANSGLASLQAAANPEDTDYWYYIHDNSGQIHFAETLDEHNANIRKYLAK